jgi:hypothetical protein
MTTFSDRIEMMSGSTSYDGTFSMLLDLIGFDNLYSSRLHLSAGDYGLRFIEKITFIAADCRFTGWGE